MPLCDRQRPLCAAPVSGFHFKVPGLTQAAGGSEWIFKSSILEPHSLRPRVQGQSWAPEQALPPWVWLLLPCSGHTSQGQRGEGSPAGGLSQRGSLKITGLAVALEGLWEVTQLSSCLLCCFFLIKRVTHVCDRKVKVTKQQAPGDETPVSHPCKQSHVRYWLSLVR